MGQRLDACLKTGRAGDGIKWPLSCCSRTPLYYLQHLPTFTLPLCGLPFSLSILASPFVQLDTKPGPHRAMALPTPSPTLYISNLETKTKKPGECHRPILQRIEPG